MGIKGNSGAAVGNLLKEGVREGVYPGAVLLVAVKDEIILFEWTGNRMLLPEPLPMEEDTPFDLASLTKPLAAALSLMKLFDRGAVHLDQTLGDLLQTTVPSDKSAITLRHLLSHCAGFRDWVPFYLELHKEDPRQRRRVLRERLLQMPLAYRPGKQSLYSDLGFMILEWVVEQIAGLPMPRFLEQEFFLPLSLEEELFFCSTEPKIIKTKFAATENCPWRKRILQGEVHDENAWALGGYSGHAGIFGTAHGVYRLADLLRKHFNGSRDDYLQPKTVRTFFEKQTLVPGSNWALGWDTPSPVGSSAGRYFSSKAVGHLGFTGTSLWMDLYHHVTVVFLTNRVHPSRENTAIRTFRPRLHNLVMEQLGLGHAKREEGLSIGDDAHG
jgi:CubicO group peptidase (beta-lactamase class C family)